MRAILSLLALSCCAVASAVAAALPPFQYKYSSFATQTPDQAASFLSKYMGATSIPAAPLRDSGSASRVERAVRFRYGAQWHDVRFVSDPGAPVGAMLPVENYTDALHAVHRFDVQETWDWFQDWHLCLTVSDIDLIAYRLVRDGVPIVTRSSYSFYVEVTPGVTFQILGKKMDLVWSELFSFCRNTTEDSDANMISRDVREMVIGAAPNPLPPIPQLAPSHHSYFSTMPAEQGRWTRAHTSATQFDMNAVWQESHRYSDGRCAVINWLDFTTEVPSEVLSEVSSAPSDPQAASQAPQAPQARRQLRRREGGLATSVAAASNHRATQTFQVHFIDQYRKKEGRGEGGHLPLRVADVETKLVALHTNSMRGNTTNAYMDFRAGFEVPRGTLDAVARSLETDATPWM